MMMSKEMSDIMQFTMVQGMGAATWETSMHRIQAKTYVERELAWMSILTGAVAAGKVDANAPEMQFPSAADMGLSKASAYIISKNWQHNFVVRAEYRKRELQAVVPKHSHAFDVTYQAWLMGYAGHSTVSQKDGQQKTEHISKVSSTEN